MFTVGKRAPSVAALSLAGAEDPCQHPVRGRDEDAAEPHEHDHMF